MNSLTRVYGLTDSSELGHWKVCPVGMNVVLFLFIPYWPFHAKEIIKDITKRTVFRDAGTGLVSLIKRSSEVKLF